MMRSVVAFLTDTVLLLSLLFGFRFPMIKADCPADYGFVSERKAVSSEIYAVDTSNIGSDELDTLICLQGLAARDKASIFLLNNSAARSYLSEYEKNGCTVIYEDPRHAAWTLKSLIERFKDCIADRGFTLYRKSEKAEGLNVACNYAIASGWLAVPEELKEFAEGCGLTLKCDLTTETYDYSFQQKHFDKLKKCFNKAAVIHEDSNMHGLRDWAVQQGFFMCFASCDKEGKAFLHKVFRFTGKNTAVFGWTDNEDAFVKFLSSESCYITPSDHSYNNSYIANADIKSSLTSDNVRDIKAENGKHYAAIVFSDGDNSQWVQNGFGHFYDYHRSGCDFPVTWTFPLVQQELSPVSKKLVYSASEKNDCFIGGVSGIGYMNPSFYGKYPMLEFVRRTVGAMKRSDINVVSVLDSRPDKYDYFSFYSAFDTVKGGIVQVSPNFYASGKGRVWFSSDKPFVSVRFSLWHPSGDPDEVTGEWLSEQAAIVNSFKADINSINGYSVINVHPWTISVSDLKLFVSMLDEHIELVTAQELIELISENCPHKNAVVS